MDGSFATACTDSGKKSHALIYDSQKEGILRGKIGEAKGINSHAVTEVRMEL